MLTQTASRRNTKIVDDMIGLLPSISSHEVDNRIGAMLLEGLDLRIAEISREQTFCSLQNLEFIALDVDLQYQRLASKRKRLVQRNDVDLITVLVRRHDRRQRAEAWTARQQRGLLTERAYGAVIDRNVFDAIERDVLA